MRRIHGILFTISMVLAFITLVILSNTQVLNYEDISIMYWGLGFIALWYILLWIIVVKIVLGVIRKIKGKF